MRKKTAISYSGPVVKIIGHLADTTDPAASPMRQPSKDQGRMLFLVLIIVVLFLGSALLVSILMLGKIKNQKIAGQEIQHEIAMPR